jgi:hypothetical protein
MKKLLIVFLLFTACTNKQANIETTKEARKISFATSLSADANKINQLYLYSNSDGEGYVKLIHFGHKVQHLGEFVEDPNGTYFNFSIEKSLRSTVMDSEKYEDYYLNIVNDTKDKDLQLKVHYEALNKDTIIVLKKYNMIPLRKFKNPKQSKITIEIIHPKFKLPSHSFEYYYSGLTISDQGELESAIHFKKTKETISLYEYLESNDTRKVREYKILN